MLSVNPPTAKLPPNGIREIVNLALARPPGSVIRLEQGEPSFMPPPNALAAASEAMARRTGYTQSLGVTALREAVLERLRRVYGMRLGLENVVITQGAVEAIYLALAAVLQPGDEVLVPDPAWPTYEMQVLSLGAEPVRYPLRANNDFQPDADEITRLFGPRTRALILNSPSNPTGTVMGAELLARLVEAAASRGVLVISDEVYDEIVYDGHHVSARQFAPDSVVSVFSFSKTYSMTGWRVGYAVVPDWLTTAANRIQETLISCISEISQHAALAALTGPQESVRYNLDTYRRRRDLSVTQLAERGVHTVPPAGAFYLMVPLDPRADSRRAALDLLDWGVAVAPGTAFGVVAGDQLRLSLASSEDDLRGGIRTMLEWYEQTAGGVSLAVGRGVLR